jgi:hypothetical protein
MYFLYVCSLGIHTGTMEFANSNFTYPMRFPEDDHDQGRPKYVGTIM